MLNYEFITALLSFTVVMVVFNIIKDFIIIPQFNLSRKTLDNINKRWYISFIIGAIILFLIYGRAGPI